MRVYELSKKLEITSKDLLEALKGKGFDVKSHMSVLSDDQLIFLQEKFKQKPVEKIKKKTETDSQSTPQKAPDATKKETPSMHVQTDSIKPSNVVQPAPSKVVTPPPSKYTQVIEKPQVIDASAPILEIVLESMSVGDAALKMHKTANDLILSLLKWGIVVNKNQLLTEDLVARLATQYQMRIIKPSTAKQAEQSVDRSAGLSQENMTERLPIVVVVGHVDHGKTTLLDFIRKTRVAAKEKGGITQHLGAYEAQTPQGNIVFLDTPGHEAFSKMRARGIKVADIAILVIAADDGIMPQTVEAMKSIKSMEVPIIVAVNKIDKVDAQRLEVVKRQLAQYDLLPEEWGGQTVVVPISAKEGKNIDALLEMVLLQAQLMELKADVGGPAKGYVLESKLEKGRGSVATLLCQQGTVKVGDYFICGNATGKVSSLVDSRGQRVMSVGPSVPVLVAGFDVLPETGSYFEVVAKEDQRKPQATERKAVPIRTLAKENAINIIVKTDSNSSKEALLESIEKLSKKSEKSFTIVHAGVGDISESDVMLAADTGSRIITLHVKPDQNAELLAQRQNVTINSFNIIYKLLEALEVVAQAAKKVKMVRKKIGEASVLRIFDIKNIGVIAGAYVKEGRFSKDGTVVVLRGNRKVGEGKIKSLQRDKKNVKEVHTNFECAFLIDGVTDWAVDDRVECYLEVPEA
ncbi:MAG: translation initiation factor IF-2 [Candidatus Dependentiae bacterium]|nr:translation initiation factor IF-2 [Candidatus Dependentiae bacterium]